jgi:GntR family transcriptional regulator
MSVLTELVHSCHYGGFSSYEGGSILITLNYRDSRPIYEQVKDGLRRLVMTGALLPGDKLPSVRALASSLAINPNTIARAYEALESEGYVYTVSGKGTFAAEQSDVNRNRRESLLQSFDAAAAELLFLGTTREELAQRLEALGKPLQEVNP